MNSIKSVSDYEQMFKLSERHSLSIARSHTETRGDTVFETQWLDERNEQDLLVARFRAWSNQSTQPPYRKQTGWERFSINGDLLDREILYSKRANNEWLH